MFIPIDVTTVLRIMMISCSESQRRAHNNLSHESFTNPSQRNEAVRHPLLAMRPMPSDRVV